MKYLFFAFWVAIGCLGSYGCKKDKDSTPGCRLVSTRRNGLAGSADSIIYDEKGRIFSVINKTPAATNLRNFNYNGNIIVVQRAINGSVSGTDSVWLNSAGLIEKIRTSMVGITTVFEYRFTYNGQELATYQSFRNSIPTSSTTYRYNRGNLASADDGNSVTTYSYDESQPAVPGEIESTNYYVQFGAVAGRNRNLLTGKNIGGIQYNYEYSYDSRGNISRIRVNGGAADDRSHNWDCD